MPAGSAGMRFRPGNADLYVKQGSVPTTGSYGFASAVAGSDLIALNPGQYPPARPLLLPLRGALDAAGAESGF